MERGHYGCREPHTRQPHKSICSGRGIGGVGSSVTNNFKGGGRGGFRAAKHEERAVRHVLAGHVWLGGRQAVAFGTTRGPREGGEGTGLEGVGPGCGGVGMLA